LLYLLLFFFSSTGIEYIGIIPVEPIISVREGSTATFRVYINSGTLLLNGASVVWYDPRNRTIPSSTRHTVPNILTFEINSTLLEDYGTYRTVITPRGTDSQFEAFTLTTLVVQGK